MKRISLVDDVYKKCWCMSDALRTTHEGSLLPGIHIPLYQKAFLTQEKHCTIL